MPHTTNRAVVTIAMGADPAYWYGIKSLADYAERVRAEFIVINKPLVQSDELSDPRHIAWLQKIAALKLVERFESVLYVDADVIATPRATDLFSLLEQQDVYLAMYDEGHLGRDHYFNAITDIFSNKTLSSEIATYYNAGVIYLRSSSPLAKLLDVESIVKAMYHGVPCPEQTWLNYSILSQKLPCFSLPRSFNFMQESGVDRMVRFDADFIHYAGYSFRKTKRQKRVSVMRRDYVKLFITPSLSSSLKVLCLTIRDGLQGVYWSISKKTARLLRLK